MNLDFKKETVMIKQVSTKITAILFGGILISSISAPVHAVQSNSELLKNLKAEAKQVIEQSIKQTMLEVKQTLPIKKNTLAAHLISISMQEKSVAGDNFEDNSQAQSIYTIIKYIN